MKLTSRLFLCILFCLAAAAFAADKPDFSGSYTFIGIKGQKSDNTSDRTLKVTQTETSIEVTVTDGSHSTTNTYPLNGQPGTCIGRTGLKGLCKGQWRKNILVLETNIVGGDDKGHVALIVTRQKWELLADLKTLKIHFEIDSPQLPMSVVDPWTEIYARN